MEDGDTTFASRVQAGDMIIGGRNFGCGSSREHAPICIKAAGVSCVIAKSFARIFYRNSINIGLPILECEVAVEAIAVGDHIVVDTDSGVIKNLTKNESYTAKPFPPFMQELIQAGGLMNFVAQKAGEKHA